MPSDPVVRFTAEDFRREIARVRKARKRNVVIVAIVVAIVAIAIVVGVLAGVNARAVADEGMAPSLSQGQFVVTARDREPASGDVIAFHGEAGDVQFARIVAGPGDWVSVASDGTVAVSEQALSADSAKNVFGDNASSVVSRVVPENSFYVLADAENATTSGLTDETDFVDAGRIAGRAVATVWPVTSVGLVS